MGIAILSAPVLRAGDSVPGGGRTAAEIVTEAPVSLVGENDTPAVGESDTLTLRDVIVSSTFSKVSRSPLRLVTIDSETLRERAAARTYPELLKGIPSLYATSESGSYGDAKLNIRGFGQENISVLLNGIPISGLVTGSMYWNNWMGLASTSISARFIGIFHVFLYNLPKDVGPVFVSLIVFLGSGGHIERDRRQCHYRHARR